MGRAIFRKAEAMGANYYDQHGNEIDPETKQIIRKGIMN